MIFQETADKLKEKIEKLNQYLARMKEKYNSSASNALERFDHLLQTEIYSLLAGDKSYEELLKFIQTNSKVSLICQPKSLLEDTIHRAKI